MALTNMAYNSTMGNNPIVKVTEFLERQEQFKTAKKYDEWRFIGYVLDINYDGATIITSDAYKKAVGGIPRGSFLILVPSDYKEYKPHFSLLRVKGITDTPLKSQVQQTYFEMQKKSMPELDIWTQGELQWGALECDVLGMFYANPNQTDKLSFSGDVNNVVSAHRYEVFAPDEELLDMIINDTVRNEFKETIGYLRTMECQFDIEKQQQKQIPVKISMKDFMGCRTAMFGKTRLGKSNVVKLIAQNMIDATKETHNVGQLIFDINGEYANDNPQDNNSSIYSANKDVCEVYALTKREGTPSKELKLNFYEQFDTCKTIIGRFLDQAGQKANYVNAFASVELPSLEEIKGMEIGDQIRAIRKVQIYWAILKEAGFKADETGLGRLGLYNKIVSTFNPGFSKDVRKKVFGNENAQTPKTLEDLVYELKEVGTYLNDDNPDLMDSSGKKTLFDSDAKFLLGFLCPKTGTGPKILANYRTYHSPNADDFVKNISESLNNGKTVILDLGNATDTIRKYFSDLLSKEVFNMQEKKFVENKLGDSYIQLYFEEAHNLFPPQTKDLTDVYSRFAKEGAKFHIGMIYSTQSPSTISKELLVQTENFFIGHLSSIEEASALSKLQIAYSGIENDILKARTPGFMRMLTMSNRFVIPVQTELYNPKKED
ncbi:DUF87 domain-containing protein [uncultured Treponema sp.]|uniref:ATP-binding protein n=1 Tax=uncultured Treponema sp. TaxID=162155 RepID=UPI002583DB92|nr:DUF87 domain-containing protein [uncultured Treponema sp.]